MSADIPAFLRAPENRDRAPGNGAGVPSFLCAPKPTPAEIKAVRASYDATRYEMVFPRLMEMVCGGWQLSKAIRDLPIEIDIGLFTRWLHKDQERRKIYKEMKEIRSELWVEKMLDHATGETGDIANDVARDALAVSAYKWVIGTQNPRDYGEKKQIEVTQSISIRAALEQGTSRISQVIDVDAEELYEPRYPQIEGPPPEDSDYEDDE
jgi:hypothetical protein